MAAKYEIGQTVTTVTGDTAKIHNIEFTGESFIYECWVRGQGMRHIHETKLMGR